VVFLAPVIEHQTNVELEISGPLRREQRMLSELVHNCLIDRTLGSNPLSNVRLQDRGICPIELARDQDP
jgi:hypothetical protein